MAIGAHRSTWPLLVWQPADRIQPHGLGRALVGEQEDAVLPTILPILRSHPVPLRVAFPCSCAIGLPQCTSQLPAGSLVSACGHASRRPLRDREASPLSCQTQSVGGEGVAQQFWPERSVMPTARR